MTVVIFNADREDHLLTPENLENGKWYTIKIKNNHVEFPLGQAVLIDIELWFVFASKRMPIKVKNMLQSNRFKHVEKVTVNYD